MKLTALFLFLALGLVSGEALSQGITISAKHVPLTKLFSIIEQQTSYVVFYSPNVLNDKQSISINVKNASLAAVLDSCLKGLHLTYSIVDKTIFIKKAGKEAQTPAKNALEANRQRQIIVQGRVTDLNGNPLAGATILVVGTQKSALTNLAGIFTIQGIDRETETIEVTYIGYKTEKAIVTAAKFTTIIVTPSNNELDQVQTMAYSKTSMRYNTGTAYTITAKDIEKNPVPNVLQAIQGRVPGMFIKQQTGLPGGAFGVTVRGRSTINYNSPLYIVDGVAYPAGGNALGQFKSTAGTLPMYKQAYGSAAGDNPLQGGNALNYLDPSMIESITVLEGADATAIYGSRGAYGVVIITTKRGAAGKPKLNLNYYSGISERGTAPKLMNTQQYLEVRHEALNNDGVVVDPTSPITPLLYGDLYSYDTTSYTNWQKELTGTNAMTTKLNATYSGGTQNLNFLTGAFYNDMQDVQRGKGHDRSGGMNFDIRNATSNKKLTIDFSGSFSTDINTMVPYDFTGVNLPPDAPSLFLPNGNLNWSTGSNPAQALNELYKNVTNNLVGNLAVDYVPVKGLTFHLTGGYNLLTAKEFRGYPSSYFNPTGFSTSETNSVLNYYSIRTFTFDPNVNYATLLGGPKGKLSLTAGGTLQDKSTDNHYFTGSGFLSDALVYNPASAAQANTGITYILTPGRYAGYFGIINYTYDNKYILDLNGRRDGSTRFGPDKQWGNFGSVGGAWVFSNEKWFKNNISFIDYGKLRANYGLTGGDGIPDYEFLDNYTLTANSYQGNQGLYPTSIANPNLQWETNKEFEVALTLQFLKDRITFDGNYYHRMSSNQLTVQPLSSVTGFTYIEINSPAVIKNTGFQFTLNTKNIKTKNFTWTTSLNMTIPSNELVSYPGLAQLQNFNYQVGKPVTGILLYQYNGIDPQKGNFTFTNVAGETGPFLFGQGTQLQNSDRTVFMDLEPKFYGGLENIFNYQGWSLSFMFYFANENGPNYLGSQGYESLGSTANYPVNLADKRWKKSGDITTVPKASQSIYALFAQENFDLSTGAYSNATFARLTNANISYTFPRKWLQKAGISRLQVYVSGQNLLTISKYGDIDPENLNAQLMPPLRIFTGGLNITF